MTIKKTVTIEGVRSWTGPMENYEAHKECVEHWCGGGEICLVIKVGSGNLGDDVMGVAEPKFTNSAEYHIKSRDPQNGDVWILDGHSFIYSDARHETYRLLQINGDISCKFHHDAVYAAPSVEAYIAKKLLDKIDDESRDAYALLCEIAGEE